MKKWKLLFGVSLMSTMFTGTCVRGADSKEYKLYLDITFKENLLFDKYDVDLCVDGQEIGTLEYAKAYTKLLDVTGEAHTITFYNTSNHDYSGEEEIEIGNDSTYRAAIQTDAKKIKIVSSEIIENIDGSSINVNDVSLMFLPAAIASLKELGLNEITYSGAGGERIKKESNWIVLSQSVKPGDAIDKNEEISLTCQKITDYISEKFVGFEVPEVIKTANDIPYEISFIDVLTGRDMHNVFCKATPDELKQWKVQEAIPVESNQRVAVLNVIFVGKTVVPDVEGMSLKNAITELNMAQISNIQGLTIDGKNIKASDGEKWKVITQSEDTGEEFNSDNEIVLYCEPYTEMKEITLYELTQQAIVNEISQENIDTEKEEEAHSGIGAETEIEAETEMKTETETELKVKQESAKETTSGEGSLLSDKEKEEILSLITGNNKTG